MVSSPKAYTEQISNVSLVYNVYRIVLPLVLLVTYISSRETSQLGVLAPTLFVQINMVYAIYGVIITFFTPGSRKLLQNQHVLTGMLIGDIRASSSSCVALRLFCTKTSTTPATMDKPRPRATISSISVNPLLLERSFMAIRLG
jgi:hypothetical protein